MRRQAQFQAVSAPPQPGALAPECSDVNGCGRRGAVGRRARALWRPLFCAVVTTLLAAPPGRADGWSAPSCSAVRGTDFITFSVDRGRTLAPTRRRPGGIVYTLGLVALSRPGALLAVSDGTLLRSNDAGCSWFALGSLRSRTGGRLWRLTAGRGGFAYAWYENEPTLWRVRGARLGQFAVPGDGGPIGVGVDSSDGRRLRVASGEGGVYESLDGGESWTRRGTVPGASASLLYRAAFDPRDLDHILIGTANRGVLASHDGGRSWSPARGLSAAGGPVNVFEVVFAGSGKIAWAMGIDLDQNDAGAPSQGRHLYRSGDGGRSFAPVVDQDRTITLRNGPVMAPDPADPDGLYFIFGTFFSDYGTDLFRYDHRSRRVVRRHSAYDDFGALAFDPAAPDVVYVGVISERGIR